MTADKDNQTRRRKCAFRGEKNETFSSFFVFSSSLWGYESSLCFSPPFFFLVSSLCSLPTPPPPLIFSPPEPETFRTMPEIGLRLQTCPYWLSRELLSRVWTLFDFPFEAVPVCSPVFVSIMLLSGYLFVFQLAAPRCAVPWLWSPRRADPVASPFSLSPKAMRQPLERLSTHLLIKAQNNKQIKFNGSKWIARHHSSASIKIHIGWGWFNWKNKCLYEWLKCFIMNISPVFHPEYQTKADVQRNTGYRGSRATPSSATHSFFLVSLFS